MSLRQRIGALIHDWVPFQRRLSGDYLEIRNRRETISRDGRGVRCEWRYSSDLHISKLFPSLGARLMRRALGEWPIVLRDEPERGTPPRVTFIIGHRGTARLPHLLQTIRSIAGQRGVAVECIVVEQAPVVEAGGALPSWVRHVHTPPPDPAMPYCRSWTFNVGARIAASDVLVLHDNDMLVPAGWAREALRRVEEGVRFADLKRFIFYLDECETGRIFATGQVPRGVPSTVVQNLQGGSIVAERQAYMAIGGFDESFIGWGGEDNDFWDRALVHGGANGFGYLPVLHLHHPAQPGKVGGTTSAVERYRAIEVVPAQERIARLLLRRQGRMEGPASE